MDSLAAVFREVGAPLSIERIALDPPGPSEVLVRVAAVGLCRTDYHVMRGERRVAMRPMVLGHEAAGVVEQTGDTVGGIQPGDHVVLTFIPGCGKCHWCRRGLHHLCAEGARITQGPQLDGSYRRRDRDGVAVGAFCMIGAFAERAVVDQASVVVIGKDIPFDLASLVACGVPAGVGAARQRARVQPGESVLVVGCGGDGMNVVQGARLVRRRQDHRRRYRAGQARLGARVRRDAWHQRGRRCADSRGARANGRNWRRSCLCLHRSALDLASGIPRHRQGRQRRGHGADAGHRDGNQDSAAGAVRQPEGHHGRGVWLCQSRLQIPELLALYRKGDLKLRELITRTYRLDDINRGYADLEAGKNLRGVVVFGG